MNARERRRPIVLFSTADWDWPYWTNKQHMARRLAARGFRVLYVESIGIRRPGLGAMDLSRMARRIRSAAAPPRAVAENLWVLSPLAIPLGRGVPLVERFNARLIGAGVARWLARFGAERPIIWTYHPFILEVAEHLDPALLVYHCVDNLGAVPGVDRAAYDRTEAELLARADHVFVTSRELARRCRANASVHYFPNVADIAHFAQARRPGPIPAELSRVPRPRAAYIGVLSDFKIDLALVESLVALRVDWSFVFVGDEREGQSSGAIRRLRQRSNAHFLGWQPYATLPNLLRGIDVALLPQSLNDYTRAMFPMKFFEYLAAGRPVVATPLPALAELSSLYRSAVDAGGFAFEIERLLNEPGSGVLPADAPVLHAHSWDARIEAMLAIIDA